jgi:hypothetical protein
MIASADIESHEVTLGRNSSPSLLPSLIKKKPLQVALIAAVVTIAAAVYWRVDRAALEQQRIQYAEGALLPIATLLRENQHLLSELQAQPFAQNGTHILEAYLAEIRTDGVAKHADMKQRFDQLAENNTAIVTLIKAYAPRAQTLAFRTEADKFRNYSSAWRDRWNSVMEIFMAGGNYPVAETPFPTGFPAATDAEIAAMR